MACCESAQVLERSAAQHGTLQRSMAYDNARCEPAVGQSCSTVTDTKMTQAVLYQKVTKSI